VALAHPLGNFTINHYAGIRVSSDRVIVDLVIDEAEIPTFQDRQRIDANGDGAIDPTEMEAERVAVCPRLLGGLSLTINGAPASMIPVEAGLSFLPGAGGLTTMRIVCELAAPLASRISSATSIAVLDSNYPERIGWREIDATADGVTLAAADGSQLLTTSPSLRLTSYPTDLLSRPLSTVSVAISATPGGPAVAPWHAPDASPLPGADLSLLGDAAPGSNAGTPDALVGAIPGGVGTDLSSFVAFGGEDLSPLVLLGSLLVAVGLGAAHAISPGHGKTIMAAYLVGTRGTARQAVALGLAVTVSHTLGVLVLAVLSFAAASVLPPERLYPILEVASGGLVVIIGGRLLLGRVRPVLAARRAARAHAHDANHGHDASPEHERGHEHPHDHGHSHGPGLAHGHDHGDGVAAVSRDASGGAVSWRSLVSLGLAGGLVPSASALILLLGSIAAGRVAYGIVLVVAFGIGMALVLGGVGIALVHASRLAGRLPGAGVLGRRWDLLQVATAVLVVALGVVLTSQALTQVL
jgi:ABC-type nickel/cobalt efflux system permease component RcnA